MFSTASIATRHGRCASRPTSLQALLADDGPQHVRVLVAAQFETADRLIRRFIELGVPPSLHTATPSDDVVISIAGLTWASLQPELRPLLRNFKVLDWVVVAARSGTAINDPSFIGLTYLIDALWERWIEGDTDGLGRSRVLMHLGVLEGETLSTGVPRMQLEASEQPALGALAASDLVRLRDERVRFSHDLLGDWARMRVLVGEQSFASPASRDRANLPRWHRAMRLYGQRLLEQSADGSERWQRAIADLGEDSPTGSVIRDLFLGIAVPRDAMPPRCWSAAGRRCARMAGACSTACSTGSCLSRRCPIPGSPRLFKAKRTARSSSIFFACPTGPTGVLC